MPKHTIHTPLRTLLLWTIGLCSLALFAGHTTSTVLAQAGPTIVLNRTAPTAGDVVTVSGNGFAANGGAGELRWDDTLIGTVQILPGGYFFENFVVPTNAVPGDHQVEVCSGSPCFTGPAAQTATVTVRVAAAAPHFTGAIAYVYRTDTTAAKRFSTLLTNHGFSVQLVPLADVLATDFTQFDLTIIADDTGNSDTWGSARSQASFIAKQSKVFALGEGGYAFLGQLGLSIGYPNGAHGASATVFPSNAGLAYYQKSYHIGADTGAAVQIYTNEVGMVEILTTNLDDATLPVGYAATNGEYTTLVSEGCNHLWGFQGDPAAMTPIGRNLFLNGIAHALGMPCSTSTAQLCQEITSPTAMPSPGLITFDELPNATVVGDSYASLYGVHFEDGRETRAITYGLQPDQTPSRPNFLINQATFPATSANVPLRITFDQPKTHVGFYMGNGEGQAISGMLIAYNVQGEIICRVANPVPEANSEFIGLYDALGRIAEVRLDYGNTALSEAIDNLTFAPNPQRWRIQLCQESADNCLPAAGTVYRLNEATGGDPFAVDSQGYVLDSGAIAFDDQLWALSPQNSDADHTLYHTSGDPLAVTAARFAGDPATLHLVTTSQQPLMLHNLTMSAQWVVQNDLDYRDWLADNIRLASDKFYDFTNGQMALGTVTVRQNYEGWDAADIWLFANNSLRPEAEIGGMVDAVTVDPFWDGSGDKHKLVYEPGRAYMGSTWNRYGLPGAVISVTNGISGTVDTSEDWAAVLAHELGHYLLFLDDTYFRYESNFVIENVYSCTGSAMGWVYFAENTEFVFDGDHWTNNCLQTAHNDLLQRTEWQTMRLWYPWLAPPTSDDGPNAPPVALTKVTFVTPSGAPPLSVSQIFDLDYRDNETASAEARALLYRGNRVIDQGKPSQGSTQIELHGAQDGDRLCLIDINDNAQAPDTPRNQYGCETIHPGDSTLFLEKNSTWAPIMLLDPITPTIPGGTTLAISVTQPLAAGTVLKVNVYPEHANAVHEATLSGADAGYSGQIDLPFTPAAYVQLFVDEAEAPDGSDPRREAIIDYGVGGGGLHGPTSSLGWAPIISSSDGRAFFVARTGLALAAGQFIALQSMAGTPPLPAGTTIVDQSYRLIAYPSSLVDVGSINLRFNAPLPLQAAAAGGVQGAGYQLHFWDGQRWLPLATTLTIEPGGNQLASAPSMGSGIYALLQTPDLAEQLYLPVIQR